MARLTISCIVRRFCLDCQGNSSRAVRECADTGCALWEHRLPPQGAENPTPVAAVPPAEAATTLAPVAAVPPARVATLLVPAAPAEGATKNRDAASFANSPDAIGRLANSLDDAGRPVSSPDDAGRPVSSPDDAQRLANNLDASGRLANPPDAAQRLAARRAILRAVRRHCMSCAACRADVRTCAARECGLWSYRFGVYPETYRAVRQRFFRPKALSLF